MNQALATSVRPEPYGESAAHVVGVPAATPAVSPLVRVRPLVVVVVTALVFVVVQMGLSITLDHGAFKLANLQTQQGKLQRVQQASAEQLAVNEAPQTIAKAAIAYNMTTAQAPLFLNLKDHSIVGTTKVPEGADAYVPMTENLVSNAAQRIVDGSTKPTIPVAKTMANIARQRAAQLAAAQLIGGAQGGITTVTSHATAPVVRGGTDAASVGAPSWQAAPESVQ